MATQPLSVDLHIKELVYDIQTKTYNTAESLKASGKLKYDGAAHVMASDDEQSLYELKRAIATAIGDANVALNEYIDEGTGIEEFDTTKAYSNGDLVYYQGKIYEFTRSHAAGAWNTGDVTEQIVDESNLLTTDIDTQTKVQMRFTFPNNFKGVYSDAFANGLHDFIVNRAAYVWYRQVVPEIAQACLADADSALEQVNKAMYSRKRPTRPFIS